MGGDGGFEPDAHACPLAQKSSKTAGRARTEPFITLGDGCIEDDGLIGIHRQPAVLAQLALQLPFPTLNTQVTNTFARTGAGGQCFQMCPSTWSSPAHRESSWWRRRPVAQVDRGAEKQAHAAQSPFGLDRSALKYRPPRQILTQQGEIHLAETNPSA